MQIKPGDPRALRLIMRWPACYPQPVYVTALLQQLHLQPIAPLEIVTALTDHLAGRSRVQEKILCLQTRGYSVHKGFLIGKECQICGKLQIWEAMIIACANHNVRLPDVCWHLTDEQPTTREFAVRSTVTIGTYRCSGVFPSSRARLTRCSPDIPKNVRSAAFQRMADECAATEYTFIPSPRAPDIACTVMVLGINCGNLAQKQEKLAALIVQTEPDIVCLQEVWETAFLDCLRLLPYHQFRSVSFQGGGLVILVHLRWLGKQKPKISLNEHWMGVTVKRSTLDSLAVVNVHFPPEVHPESRITAIKESAEFLLGQKCSAHILQGDINADDKTS